MRGGDLILRCDWVVKSILLSGMHKSWAGAIRSMWRYMLLHDTPVQGSFGTVDRLVSHLVFQEGR